MLWIELAGQFLDKLEECDISYSSLYIEGKNQLVISMSCTGGKHRSVTLTNEIAERMVGLKLWNKD